MSHTNNYQVSGDTNKMIFSAWFSCGIIPGNSGTKENHY